MTARIATAGTAARTSTLTPVGTPTTPFALDLPAHLPFHELVARAQRAERERLGVLWISGPGAPAVASRLLRLTRTLDIGAELDFSRGAAAAALDAVALTQLGGRRAHVLVPDARHVRALARQLDLRPRARQTRFGGDAFTATLDAADGRGASDVQVTAVVGYEGDLVAALPFARAIVVTASTGVDAHGLVRRARAAGAGWPDVTILVTVPADERPSAWPRGDGLVLAHRG